MYSPSHIRASHPPPIQSNTYTTITATLMQTIMEGKLIHTPMIQSPLADMPSLHQRWYDSAESKEAAVHEFTPELSDSRRVFHSWDPYTTRFFRWWYQRCCAVLGGLASASNTFFNTPSLWTREDSSISMEDRDRGLTRVGIIALFNSFF